MAGVCMNVGEIRWISTTSWITLQSFGIFSSVGAYALNNCLDQLSACQ